MKKETLLWQFDCPSPPNVKLKTPPTWCTQFCLMKITCSLWRISEDHSHPYDEEILCGFAIRYYYCEYGKMKSKLRGLLVIQRKCSLQIKSAILYNIPV